MFRSTWIRRISSVAVTVTMAGFGMTGMASAQSISNTGPGSKNSITSTVSSNCQLTNNNNVSAHSSNTQNAMTGDAESNGNTASGLSWTGWSGMDPATAQANGTGYGSWWSGVVSWIGQRASGDGWNSNATNLSWTPANASWSGMDPAVWQANGQSFGNWYNSVESYLNSNSSNWLLTWSPDASGNTGLGGVTTGNATNNYNANFSININNTARAAAGTNSCGQSNFTPPPSTGGMGAGSGWTAPVAHAATQSGGTGSGYSGGGSTYHAPASHTSSAPVSHPSAPAVPSTPVTSTSGGGMGSGPAMPAQNTISTTGPHSVNTITTSTSSNYQVTNNNDVSVSSTNCQTATTGSTYSNGNTSGGGAGTGNANNANGSGGSVDVNN